jgi:hypothetical protein
LVQFTRGQSVTTGLSRWCDKPAFAYEPLL